MSSSKISYEIIQKMYEKLNPRLRRISILGEKYDEPGIGKDLITLQQAMQAIADAQVASEGGSSNTIGLWKIHA